MLLQRIFGHLVNLENKDIQNAFVNTLLWGAASLVLFIATVNVAIASNIEIALVATLIVAVPFVGASFCYVLCFDKLMRLIHQDKQ
tara:strand:- start:551 stop:808 length:258 start_codon:yes stop_codon:yes gene_type:complete